MRLIINLTGICIVLLWVISSYATAADLVSIKDVNIKLPKGVLSNIILLEDEKGVSYQGKVGVHNYNQTFYETGSIWFIGEGGVVLNNSNLLEGKYYIVGEKGDPLELKEGEIKAVKKTDEDINIYEKADKNSISLAKISSQQFVEIILPGKNSWDKVKTDSNVIGWVETESLGVVEFLETQK